MAADVLFLVSCTNRKTRTSSSSLGVRNLLPGSIESRAKRWLKNLRGARGPTVAARSLYAGDHWHVVRSLAESAEKHALRSQILICSAGYGLISTSAQIRPYSATFSSNHLDSVVQSLSNSEAVAARRMWWSTLASWKGPEPGSARSLAEAFRGFEYVFIALSPPYIEAIGDDLSEALRGATPERVSIFSAGTKPSNHFGEYLIPCDSSLRSILGGACNSLNVRCLRHAIEQASDGLDRESVKRRFARHLDGKPVGPRAKRGLMSDDDVTDYILKAFVSNPTVKPSPLLRLLRDSGKACEQSRFSELFRRARGRGDD